MATISITIPDAHLPRIITAVSERNGYLPTLENGSPNPQTRAQFVKAWVAQLLRGETRAYELAQARAIADTTVTEVTPT